MTTYVVITEHPPQLCQTSNAMCGALFGEFGQKQAASQSVPGFRVLIGPLITSDHRSFLVIQADDYDLVRKFAVQSGAVQWNAVTTIPVIDYETALAEVHELTPLFTGDVR